MVWMGNQLRLGSATGLQLRGPRLQEYLALELEIIRLVLLLVSIVALVLAPNPHLPNLAVLLYIFTSVSEMS